MKMIARLLWTMSLLGWGVLGAKESLRADWLDISLQTGEIAPYAVHDDPVYHKVETCSADFATIEKNQHVIMERLDSLRLKIDHLEKQQRDFLALISDIVMKPTHPSAAQEYTDYQVNLDLMKAQQYSQALKSWKKFVQDYPSSDKTAYAYYWMGELYMFEGNPQRAKDCYQLIIDQYPMHVKTPEAFFKLGQLEMQDGHKDKAMFLFKTIVKQYPLSQATCLAKKILVDIAPVADDISLA